MPSSAIYFTDQIDIQNFQFEPPLFSFIKSHSPCTILFDFDSGSEAAIITYAERLAKESDKTLLIISAEKPDSLKHLVNLNNYFLDNAAKCFVLQIRDNEVLSRFFRPLEDHFLYTDNEILQKEFITNVL